MTMQRRIALLLAVLLVCGGVVGVASALPINFTPNSETINVGGYFTFSKDNAAAGTSIANTSTTYLGRNNLNRVRQDTNITQITVNITFLSTTKNVTFQLWRERTPTEWDLVHSEEILPKLTSLTLMNVSLNNPVATELGDYPALSFNSSSPSSMMKGISGYAAGSLYRTTPSPSITFDWLNGKNITYTTLLPLMMWTNEDPVFVGLGDSLISGHYNMYSFIEASFADNFNYDPMLKLSGLLGNKTFQSLGIGGQTTDEIADRFTSDALSKHPKFIVVNGGTNDLISHFASSSNITYITNMSRMMDLAISNNIPLFILEIPPCSYASNDMMRARDLWTHELEDLVISPTYAGKEIYLVNASARVGQFRVGGDVGNLWDQKASMAAVGETIHFNESGYAEIAEAISDKINEVNYSIVAQFTPWPGPVMRWQPDGVTFQDISTGSPMTWDWNFGDGTTSALQNPTHSWSTPGMYLVTLNASNSYTYSLNSTWVESGINGFTMSSISGTAPHAIAFTNTTVGNVSARTWDFGDGGTSIASDPTHTYTNFGNFVVTLTVTNLGVSNTTVGNVTIYENLVASFTKTGNGVIPLTVQFNDTSNNATTWNWTMGDGNTSVLQNPSYIYRVPGDYTVTLNVTNSDGAFDTASAIVEAWSTWRMPNLGAMIMGSIIYIIPAIVSIIGLSLLLYALRHMGEPGMTVVLIAGVTSFLSGIVIIIILVYVVYIVGGTIESLIGW